MIVHSDRGGQYAGNKFRKLIGGDKWLQSMSRADDPSDNAFMESCFSCFKAKLLQGGAFQNRKDAQTEIFDSTKNVLQNKEKALLTQLSKPHEL